MSTDEEQLQLDKRVQEWASAYEAGFAKVEYLSAVTGTVKFLSEAEWKKEYIRQETIMKHVEAHGRGDSPDEAYADFQEKVAGWPSGGHLVWRVKPECAWTRDFRTGKTVWQIYARAAVL